jgi:GMP synthase-like glutamine amidotransferase
MKIGILRCGHTPDEVAATHGQYEDMFARLLADEGLEFRTWSVVDMAFPESPEDAEGWLVSGSRHGAYDALPFIAPLEDFIRRVVASGRPLVGICFGHQLIAQALGGTVVKFPRGWSVGAKSYDWDGLGEIWLTAWHQDQVIAPPDGARTIARNAFTEHAALLYDDPIFTVQAHPEFSRDVAAAYLAARRGSPDYPEGMIEDAQRRLDQPLDDTRIGKALARFLKHRTIDHV